MVPQIDPPDPALPPVAGWNTLGLRLGNALAGRRLPIPVHASLSNPAPIVDWAAAVRFA